MSTDPLASYWVHDIAIERFAGSTAFGDEYDDAVTVAGFVSDDDRLVRDPSGEQVVSSTRIALPATVAPVPVGSRVTLPAAFGNRESMVISSSVGDAGGLPLPAHHEISLR